jgi:hypothetical protein
MTSLPATGGTWAQEIEPSINPLAVRYWQTVDGFIRDYLDENGAPRNLADPSVGLGVGGVFTPFAADNVSIRSDLLFENGGTNQGWYHFGELKEDATSIAQDQTVQQTMTAQSIRSIRNVFTKLDDKVTLTAIEASDLVNQVRFERSLNGFVPSDGLPGYQLVRAQTEFITGRQVMLIGTDTNGQLIAEVYPYVESDKKGKLEFARKTPFGMEFSWDVLGDPITKASMWICRGGQQWLAQGNFDFTAYPPLVTPATGLGASVVFPTPTDVTTPVYTVALQETAGGPLTAATVASGGPTTANGFTTLGITGLTSATQYNGAQVTVTGTAQDNPVTATSPLSAPFMSTSA